MTDLVAVQLEGKQTHHLGSGKVVRAGRRAVQPLFQELGDGRGPGGGMVAAGGARGPQELGRVRGGAETSGGERIESAARQTELFRRLDRRQGLLLKGSQHMPDERRPMAMR
jgi:hypothetical protein